MISKELAAILMVLSFFVGWYMSNHYREQQLTPTPVAQLNPDLPNQVYELNTHVAILRGQVSAITGRYNDHGARIKVIEDRMSILNGGN